MASQENQNVPTVTVINNELLNVTETLPIPSAGPLGNHIDLSSTVTTNDSQSTDEKIPMNNRTKKQKVTSLSILLANARSLAPKTQSLINYFEEIGLHAALITESWLKNGSELQDNIRDLELGKNITYLHHNRKTRRGRTAGGCLLYTSPSPRDRQKSRMPSSA